MRLCNKIDFLHTTETISHCTSIQWGFIGMGGWCLHYQSKCEIQQLLPGRVIEGLWLLNILSTILRILFGAQGKHGNLSGCILHQDEKKNLPAKSWWISDYKNVICSRAHSVILRFVFSFSLSDFLSPPHTPSYMSPAIYIQNYYGDSTCTCMPFVQNIICVFFIHI